MLQNGYKNVENVVGLDHEDIYWKKRDEKMKNMIQNEPLIVDS